MFLHEGPARSARKNGALAGCLALVAGFVNSGGFVLIGSFTSHVTGSVGRMADHVARGEVGAALFGLLLVVCFFGGAFAASLVIEGRQSRSGYAVALAMEAAMLAAFIAVAGVSSATHPRALDGQAALLCAAMGMQNSLVTRLSGAVVRTTHLTGVVTDLAIEAARWYRWQRAKLAGAPAPRAGHPATEPSFTQLALLGIVLVAFTVGALLGAVLTLHISRWAMVAPAIAVALASVFAFAQRREAGVAP